MEHLEPVTLLTVLGAVVGLFTILARVIEKLVVHALEVKKEKKRVSSGDSLPPKGRALPSGYTADLAVQRRAIDEVQEDVEKIEAVVRRVETLAAKDLPHQIEQVASKLDLTQKELRELRSVFEKVHSSLNSNTAATTALYEILAKVLKSAR